MFSVACEVPGVPLDRSNLCVRAFERLHPADGLSFTIRSAIPPAAGLGSSAAAIVAGLCAADHMYELDAPLFELAAQLEGHPDNVAAALLGGFVICAGDPVRLDPPAGLEGVLAIPGFEVSTAAARAALPGRGAARRRGAQRRRRLAAGARPGPGRPVADRPRPGRPLHQPHRRSLYPRSMELLERAASLGALGATISGAGPTVLFWSHWEQTGSAGGEAAGGGSRLRGAPGDLRARRGGRE